MLPRRIDNVNSEELLVRARPTLAAQSLPACFVDDFEQPKPVRAARGDFLPQHTNRDVDVDARLVRVEQAPSDRIGSPPQLLDFRPGGRPIGTLRSYLRSTMHLVLSPPRWRTRQRWDEP